VTAPGPSRRAHVVVVVSLAVLCGLWIVAVPPSAGPDEPSHVTRGAALVRGQLDGDLPTDGFGQVSYQLPGWIGEPNPGCYAFQPDVPASCASDTTPLPGIVTVNSRSAGYQLWPFVLPGVGSLFPERLSSYPARVLDASLALALIGVSLLIAARTGWLAAGGVLLALTPMAWFSVATVNPSGLAIAGGLALWVALDACRRDPTRQHRWLLAASWAALSLTRRDGLVWAALILMIATTSADDRLPAIVRRIGRGPALAIAGVTGVTLIWAAQEAAATSRLLLVVPFVLVAFVAAGAGWDALERRRPQHRRMSALAALVMAAVVGLGAVAMVGDRSRFISEISSTGTHLTEAIGVLGWLDTPVPTTAVYLWIVGLGMLAAAPLMASGWRQVISASSILVVGVVAGWVLEYVRDDPLGTWQGRYYLPLLVGVPVVLGQSRPQWPVRRVGAVVGMISLTVGLAAIGAGMRRWGVGVSGPTAPWTWDTYGSPLPPVVILPIFAVAAASLWYGVRQIVTSAPPEPSGGSIGEAAHESTQPVGERDPIV
jgi:hypothetical protein